jgi:hypothetical protein
MEKCDMDIGGVITRLRTLSEPVRVRKEIGTKGHSVLKWRDGRKMALE